MRFVHAPPPGQPQHSGPMLMAAAQHQQHQQQQQQQQLQQRGRWPAPAVSVGPELGQVPRPVASRRVFGVAVSRSTRRLQVHAGASSWGDDSAEVEFSLTQQVDFGEGLRLVGGDAALGSWDVSSGPNMTWGEGHVWRTALRLPVGTSCEFKCVRVHGDGVTWEEGGNRTLTVPGGAVRVEVQISWGCQDAQKARVHYTTAAVPSPAPAARQASPPPQATLTVVKAAGGVDAEALQGADSRPAASSNNAGAASLPEQEPCPTPSPPTTTAETENELTSELPRGTTDRPTSGSNNSLPELEPTPSIRVSAVTAAAGLAVQLSSDTDCCPASSSVAECEPKPTSPPPNPAPKAASVARGGNPDRPPAEPAPSAVDPLEHLDRASLNKHTVAQLRAMAKQAGLSRYSKLRKAELIELLQGPAAR
mmetsp:Transcript_12590/g.32260  ORF Transcript_12590/g.32260 Transcript_12590/m.32260 type:complete len:421 (+) Transcript_12590:1-1263(+)